MIERGQGSLVGLNALHQLIASMEFKYTAATEMVKMATREAVAATHDDDRSMLTNRS